MMEVGGGLMALEIERGAGSRPGPLLTNCQLLERGGSRGGWEEVWQFGMEGREV